MKIISHSILLGVLIFITSCSSSKSVDFSIADLKLFDGDKVTEHANINVSRNFITANLCFYKPNLIEKWKQKNW